MKVLDASVIVSSYFEKERFHKKAKSFLEKIIQSKETVLLPEIALPEIASAIARGTGISEYAIKFCQELRRLPCFVFVPVDETLSNIAIEITSNYFLNREINTPILFLVSQQFGGATFHDGQLYMPASPFLEQKHPLS